MPRKLTKEEFITRAKEKHGDRYSYDNVKYVNNSTPVFITCKIHGDFPQIPQDHMKGSGCPYCAKEAKTDTLDEFIVKSKEVHGDKYNYDKVEYKGNNEKVVITCPIHGDFLMTPHIHKNGHGCNKCAIENDIRRKTKTTEGVVNEFIDVHGDRYSYDKVRYVNDITPVTITCPIHGDFLMTPHNHKIGHGCDKCVKEKQAKERRMTMEEFVAKAMTKHGDKYDYSNTIINGNSRTKVKIKCNTCGTIFEQQINSHLTGCGCPKCNESHLETVTSILLEKHNIEYEPQKTFPWLKNKRKMYLDFFLPEYNIAIECQGIQHYKTHGVFNEEKVKYTQQNDILKYKLCTEHSIPIYYIKYNDDTEEKINELISKIHEGKYR